MSSGRSIPGLGSGRWLTSLRCDVLLHLAFSDLKTWVWAMVESHSGEKRLSFKKIVLIIPEAPSGAPFAFQTLKSEGRSLRG